MTDQRLRPPATTDVRGALLLFCPGTPRSGSTTRHLAGKVCLVVFVVRFPCSGHGPEHAFTRTFRMKPRSPDILKKNASMLVLPVATRT